MKRTNTKRMRIIQKMIRSNFNSTRLRIFTQKNRFETCVGQIIEQNFVTRFSSDRCVHESNDCSVRTEWNTGTKTNSDDTIEKMKFSSNFCVTRSQRFVRFEQKLRFNIDIFDFRRRMFCCTILFKRRKRKQRKILTLFFEFDSLRNKLSNVGQSHR